jgi:hypothetical protein
MTCDPHFLLRRLLLIIPRKPLRCARYVAGPSGGIPATARVDADGRRCQSPFRPTRRTATPGRGGGRYRARPRVGVASPARRNAVRASRCSLDRVSVDFLGLVDVSFTSAGVVMLSQRAAGLFAFYSSLACPAGGP